MCYPDSDLMFRLAVASSALQCVTDAEDTQLATGRGGVLRREADLQRVCLPVCSALSILLLPYKLPRLRAFFRTCIWSHILRVSVL